MKFRTLLTALALAVLAGPLAADETELGTKMEKMGGAFRALRRQISDATKNADSLAKLAVIRQNAEAATKLDPAMTKDIPAAKQKEFVARYQAEMKKFLDLVGQVEAALKANNNAEAAKLVNQLADAQKAGHKEFKKEDKKK